MHCPNCFLKISYKDAPELTECSLCGTSLKTTTRDVLEYGKFGFDGESRPAQIQLAEDVEQLMDESAGVGLINGSTGIGKSFAYLIPVLLRIDPETLQMPNLRVIIATAKKTLQDQLASKDLPFLIDKILGPDVPLSKIFTVYKGRSNYACWRLKEAVPKRDRKAYEDFVQEARSRQRPADIAHWSGSRPAWWGNVAIEHCALGAECPDFLHCKPHPEKTPIVVTNHHLAAIDAKLSPGSLFGAYDFIIFDEAHQLPDAFRSALSDQVMVKGVRAIKSTFNNSVKLRDATDASTIVSAEKYATDLGELADTFSTLLQKATRAASQNGTLNPAAIKPSVEALSTTASRLQATLLRVQRVIVDAQREAREQGGESNLGYDMNLGELMAANSASKRVHTRLNGIVTFTTKMLELMEGPRNGDPNYVVVVTSEGITVKPVESGPIYQETMQAPYQVFMSATLAMGHDFSYAKDNFGIQARPNVALVEKVYPSPFDYSINQVLLYTPKHIPAPAHAGMGDARRDWTHAISREIQDITIATRGYAFVLFSARSDMNDVLDAMPGGFWDDHNLNLVVQDGDTTATLREYLRTPRSVLFGLKSFWEGVDIAGDKLRTVIIPKLPFPFFQDPLIKALEERVKKRGGNPFNEVQVPRMIFDMQQGTGRLIRTKTDRGIVAILDPRVWTGASGKRHQQAMNTIRTNPAFGKRKMGYGKRLLDALGFLSPTSDIEVVRKIAKRYFGSKS